MSCERYQAPGGFASECYCGADRSSHLYGPPGTTDARDGAYLDCAQRTLPHEEVDACTSPWLADLKHDRASREEWIKRIVAERHAYTADEEAMIQHQLAQFAASATDARQLLKHGAGVDSSWTNYDEESGLLVGTTELVVRGAGLFDILSYLMDADSRHMQSRADPQLDVRLDIREVVNAHHVIVFTEKKTAPFQNRTFLSALTWKKLSDTQYVWCSYPIADHPSLQPSDENHAVRAEAMRCLRLTYIDEKVTKVECKNSLDLKGNVPTWVTNKITIPHLL